MAVVVDAFCIFQGDEKKPVYMRFPSLPRQGDRVTIMPYDDAHYVVVAVEFTGPAGTCDAPPQEPAMVTLYLRPA
jgi:hypothetical protein